MTTTELQPLESEALPTEAPASPARPSTASLALGPVAAVEALESVRAFIGQALRPGTDFGTIPGTGTKRVLLLPGAQKVCMYFNAFPDYSVQAQELGNGHVEYTVACRAVHRGTGGTIGMGLGTCSTMEGKYRFRKAERVCPSCGAAAIIKGKAEYGGGYLCFAKKGGCGLKYHDGDPEIEGQETGKVENAEIHDIRNTVLKMAMKRALVQAAMTLGCMSDYFDQDIEDRNGPPPRQPQNGRRPEPPRNHPPAGRQPQPAAAPGVDLTPANGLLNRVLTALAQRARPAAGGGAKRRSALLSHLAARALASDLVAEDEVVGRPPGQPPSIDPGRALVALSRLHAAGHADWIETAAAEWADDFTGTVTDGQ